MKTEEIKRKRSDRYKRAKKRGYRLQTEETLVAKRSKKEASGGAKIPDRIDGLGPKEIKKIRSAVRLVWHRSYARALVVKRCTDKDGFFRCEKCGDRTPQLKIDHTERVGDVDEGFIRRMFVPSSGLTGMCRKCHNEKTKEERALSRLAARADF